jgi:metal-responsive CopG/Arc/MetJ family transcriptional regulator
MKLKTSITLPAELLAVVDRRVEAGQSRSDFIELALRAFLAQLQRIERDSRDLETLNRYADHLNAEAEDVLA